MVAPEVGDVSEEDEDWFESALRDGEDADDGATDERVDEGSSPPDADGIDGFDEADDGAAGTRSADGEFEDGQSSGDGGDMFEDDFASAFQSAPGGGAGADVGGSTGFGGESEPFDEDFSDDEDFDSDIPRIDIGIEGLDSMIQGGVPERALMVAIGDAGTGKTTFGLQFLHAALERGENAVYITLEESHDRIVDTATEKGWEFERYDEDDQLAVIDLDPIEMANSLTSIQSELPRLIEEFDATRLVLDSVSLLEMMYDDRATRRNEIFDFTEALKEAGVTTMLTSEASEDNPYVSRHGIIEYLTDAVFVLRYIRNTDDFRETRLAVEIQKIRDANHSREIKPYEITNEGISVYRQANIF